ncbi:histone H1-like [Clupea harengus]|uniref:Histone H1-like n=1 Tax=Clupea harengus TaxID=7950 RepID=A0A6P3VXP9_CLUHA|nr:histone H1-like [Clupea harengus]
MSGVPPAPSAAPAKPAKRRSSKARKTGPTVSDRILKVVAASKERGGVSLVALKKGLATSGYDIGKNNARIRLAVRRLVTNGSLIQIKGTGASGSFKIGKKPVVKKKPIKKAKKPNAKKAKKPKRAAATKATGTPKKRRRRSKSPKKAKKPAAAKKPKSPRKAKRRVSRGKTKRVAAKKK